MYLVEPLINLRSPAHDGFVNPPSDASNDVPSQSKKTKGTHSHAELSRSCFTTATTVTTKSKPDIDPSPKAG
jgi:hypothetical protein